MEILAQTKPIRIRIAHVRQEVMSFSQRHVVSCCRASTLGETFLRSKTVVLEQPVVQIGLVSCADTNVGDAKVGGISGGGKKRLSMACELIASPSVMLLMNLLIEPLRHAEKTYETMRIVEATWNELLFSEPEKKVKRLKE